MAKTKISEFSATPANNTDIDSINIAEGCAPSGINDAIRELMAQLKDFQTGAVGDSFNGPVGTTTAAAGAFTTLSASSTVSGTGFSTYLASPPAIGGTAAAAGSFTTLSASGNVTLSGGTANGVAYLNGSKVVTSGSALTFDGTDVRMPNGGSILLGASASGASLIAINGTAAAQRIVIGTSGTDGIINVTRTSGTSPNLIFQQESSELMRLTSTGLVVGGTAATNTSSGRGNITINGSSSAILSIGTGGTAKGYVYHSGSDMIINATTGSLALQANGNGALIDSSGNLGLGVTPSAWSGMKAFQLGDGVFAMSSDGAGSGDGSLTWNGYYNGTNWIYGYTGGVATRYRQNESGHAWFYAPSGTAGNAITFTQAMTLDASGNLGVGTTSPSSRLHATSTTGVIATLDGSGTTSGAADTGAALMFNGSDGSAARNFAQISGYKENGTSGNYATYLAFSTRANGGSVTERCRITSSGNLHIARTTTADTTVGASIFADGTITCARSASDNANLNLYVYSTGAGAARFYVGMGGTVYATSTSISAISDRTLKENIRNLETGLPEVMALKPRRFDWKNGDAQNVAGFVAQEVEEVLPELVTDYVYNKDEDGNNIIKKSLKMGDILPTLVKAIQEQQAIIESLKARLDAANL